MHAVELVRAGLHTTVQDGGRWGFQHLGVPVGGALDLKALRRANTLVGNDAEEAALEVTLVGCTLRALVPTHVAVSGARFSLRVDGVPAAMDRVLRLESGSVLAMGERLGGARAYVALRGGIDEPLVLGSRSAWPMLPRRGALRDGARIALADRTLAAPRSGPLPTPNRPGVVRVLAAPDVAATPDVLSTLCAGPYRISASASRMAYPLDGAPLALRAPGRSSSGTVAGAVQVLPSGAPMLLLAERQTTGGYPIAAVVITADLSHVAQLAPGDDLRFTPCSRGEALEALWRLES